MAKLEKETGPAKRVAPAAVSVPLKPRWDDAAMQSAYANVCNVLGTREEVTLLFGTNKAWQAGDHEVQVALSQRIVLTPYTAKRLAQMLAQGVKEYEQRFGEIQLGEAAPAAPAVPAVPAPGDHRSKKTCV